MPEQIGLEAVMAMEDYNKGMKDYLAGMDQMDSTTTSVASALTGALGGVGIAVAAVGVAVIAAATTAFVALGAALWNCTKEAIKSQESFDKFDVIYKITGGVKDFTEEVNAGTAGLSRMSTTIGFTKQQCYDLAAALGRVTKFSEEEVLEAEAIIMKFDWVNAKTFPETIKLTTDLATVMGTNLATAAQQLGSAMNNPTRALMLLKQAGIEVSVQEKKMITDMVKAGDEAGAQAWLMQKLTDKLNGAAEAAGQTFSGQLVILKNQFGELKEAVGGPIMKLLSQLMSKVLMPLVPLFEKAGKAVGDFLQKFIDEKITPFLPTLERVGKLLAGLFENILSGNSKGAKAFLMSIFGELFPSAVDTLSKVYDAISGIVGSITKGDWGSVSGGISNLLGAIFGDKAKAGFDKIINVFSQVRTWLEVNIPKAINFMVGIWNQYIVPAWNAVAKFWNDTLAPIFRDIMQLWQEYFPLAIKAFQDAWATIQPAIQPIIDAFQANIMPIIQQVIDMFSGGGGLGDASTTISNIWNNTLKPALEAWYNFLITNVIPAVAQLVKWFMEQIPPALAKVKEIWDTVLQPALAALIDFVQNSVIPAVSEVVTWFQTNVPIAMQAISDFWNNTLQPALQKLYDFFMKYINPIIITAKDIIVDLVTIGFEALKGVIENFIIPGLEKFWTVVTEKVVPAIMDAYHAVVDWLGPKLEWLNTKIIKPLVDAFETGLKKALEWFYGILLKIKEFLDNFELPDWLHPGSPTPLELGLRGINKELDTLYSNLAAVKNQMTSMPTLAGLGSIGALSMGGGTGVLGSSFYSANRSVTIMFGGVNINNGADQDSLAAQIEDVVANLLGL